MLRTVSGLACIVEDQSLPLIIRVCIPRDCIDTEFSHQEFYCTARRDVFDPQREGGNVGVGPESLTPHISTVYIVESTCRLGVVGTVEVVVEVGRAVCDSAIYPAAASRPYMVVDGGEPQVIGTRNGIAEDVEGHKLKPDSSCKIHIFRYSITAESPPIEIAVTYVCTHLEVEGDVYSVINLS